MRGKLPSAEKYVLPNSKKVQALSISSFYTALVTYLAINWKNTTVLRMSWDVGLVLDVICVAYFLIFPHYLNSESEGHPYLYKSIAVLGTVVFGETVSYVFVKMLYESVILK